MNGFYVTVWFLLSELSHRMNEMPTSDPQSLGEVLSSGGLERIVRKAQEIIALNRLLQEILPKELAQHCTTMNYQADTLTLKVTSAAIATRIRYTSREILQSLHFYDKYRNIKKIDCKIRP